MTTFTRDTDNDTITVFDADNNSLYVITPKRDKSGRARSYAVSVDGIPTEDFSSLKAAKSAVIESIQEYAKEQNMPTTTAKKTVAKKATTPKKAVKKTTPKKATKATQTKASTNGRPKATGLRKPQVRVLEALSKAGKPLNRTQVASKASVDKAFCSQYLGRLDAAKRVDADKRYGFKSLITLKAVKASEVETTSGSEVVFSITATGKSLLKKATK